MPDAERRLADGAAAADGQIAVRYQSLLYDLLDELKRIGAADYRAEQDGTKVITVLPHARAAWAKTMGRQLEPLSLLPSVEMPDGSLEVYWTPEWQDNFLRDLRDA